MSPDRMEAGQQAFSASLPKRLQLIRNAVTALEAPSPDPATLDAGALAAHSLAGSAALFGHMALGEAARAMNRLFVSLDKSHAALDEVRLALFREKCHAVLLAAEPLLPGIGETAGEPDDSGRDVAVAVVTEQDGDERRLLLVEDDTVLAAELARQLSTFDWQVDCVPNASSIPAWLGTHRYRAIVSDVMLPEGRLAGVEALHKLSQHMKLPPVVFLSARHDWEARLAAVRVNASAYLAKPVDVSRLLETVERLADGGDVDGGRILVVDDDPISAGCLRVLLENAHHSVQVLTDVTGVLDAIPSFSPELIVMDLHMPVCSGIDAAKVIRQDDALVGIPILFLSADDTPTHIQSARTAGADDFLAKTNDTGALVAAVNSRISRTRALNRLALRDSMTGLLNHLAIQQFLEQEANAALRMKYPLSFAMIDIDHFKAVNDTYGHPVGDAVIRGLALLLRQRLRRADVVGRYGGEEFAVILRSTELADAQTILDNLRERFADLRFHGRANTFGASFSVGVCALAPGESPESLVRRADDALYAAKRGGRNRVVAADMETKNTAR